MHTGNLRLPDQLSRKLAPRYYGPFPVLERISAVAYRVDLPASFRGVHNVFHASLLKLHHGTLPLRRAPVFIADSDAAEFEVKRIVGKRISRNRVEYLVAWKGYSHFDQTWEPVANLTNAADAVADFER